MRGDPALTAGQMQVYECEAESYKSGSYNEGEKLKANPANRLRQTRCPEGHLCPVCEVRREMSQATEVHYSRTLLPLVKNILAVIYYMAEAFSACRLCHKRTATTR